MARKLQGWMRLACKAFGRVQRHLSRGRARVQDALGFVPKTSAKPEPKDVDIGP